MEVFMRERNIDDDILQRLKQDGIDETVIGLMTDEQLGKYIPRYGDRIAILAFVHRQSKFITSSETCRERLIERLQSKSGGAQHFKRASSQTGNTNAKKMCKRVEIGWLHTYGVDKNQTIKQVRSQNGGGTRLLSIPLNASMGDVLSTVQSAFFPEGTSKKGKIDDFTFYMADQTHDKIENETTLQEVLDKSKSKTLRLYMVTIMKRENSEEAQEMGHSDTSSNIYSDEAFLPDILTTSVIEEQDVGHVITPCHMPNVDTDTSEASAFIESIMNAIPDDTTHANILNDQPNPDDTTHANILNDQPIPDDTTHANILNDQPIPDDTTHANILNDEPSGSEVSISSCNLTVHRVLLQEELVQIYKNEEILNQNIQFRYVNEKGQDVNGVSRDVYSGFWDSFLQRNADGELYRVPVLSAEYGEMEWQSIGRVLVKGYKDQTYFPVGLAPAFMVALVHGENAVTPQILKDTFLGYISQGEKEVIVSALSAEDFDDCELVDIFDRFECHTIPTKHNLPHILLQVAHKTVIQEPKYALDTMRSTSNGFWIKQFPTIESVMQMYLHMEPTVQTVLSLLKATPETKEESDSLKFLHRFIRGRNKEQLKKLLRFLTGADVICVDSISVSFVRRHGCARTPTVHTCGPSLELPSTYTSYPDFRTEWETILDTKECMIMDIA